MIKILNANDIEFLQKATLHKLGVGNKKKILKLLEDVDENKLETAMNYVYSITKVEVRGKKYD